MSDVLKPAASRSAKKRAVVVIEKLTKEILELTPGDLALLGLDQDIVDHIEASRKIKTHTAQRRQLRFLSRIIQNADTDAIVEAMSRLKTGRRADAERFQTLEDYRERLILGNEATVAEILTVLPNADKDRLRSLQLESQKEKERGTSVASSRALFKYLRQVSQS